MPGDEVAVEAGRPRRPSTGPRHAAPRKSLLVRLQVPAGKAIALAAMPTAVLMGMGLTPRLAEADELPKNGYAPGKCVSAPDTASEQDAGDENAKDKDGAEDADGTRGPQSPSASPSPSASDDAEESTTGEGGSSRRSGADPSPPASSIGGSSDDDAEDADAEDAEDGDDAEDAEDGDDADDAEAPGDESDGKSGAGLLDPILDPIFDFFDPGRNKGEGKAGKGAGTPSAAPAPSDSASGPTGEPSQNPSSRPADAAADRRSPGGAGDADDRGSNDPAPGGAEQGASPSSTVSPSPSSSASAQPQAGPSVDARGRERFPCPEEKKVAGVGEQTPNVLPDKPWVLKSTLLALHGLDYQGVVNVRTQNGSTKQALKFTASGVDIKDLHQLVDGGDNTYHVQARDGSTSTIRKGTVTMYTEKLEGKLLGIIPITFDPEHPPPLNLPEIFFTDVTVTQAGQFGGELTVPGMHVYTTRR